MKSRIFLLLIIILYKPLQSENLNSIGIDALTDLENLPNLRYGQISKQIATYDRTGGNHDFEYTGSGIPTYLYKDGDNYVIFDEQRPGCIYRIWMTYFGVNDVATKGGDLLFYFDNEETPSIRINLDPFYLGQLNPFLWPLVGYWNTSSGGYFSYTPIEFENALKLAVTKPPHFYNINYKLYNSNTNLSTLNGSENVQDALDLLKSTGEVYPYEQSNIELVKKTVSIAPDSTCEYVFSGPAQLMGIKIKLLDRIYEQDIFNICKDLWISATWDNHEETDIDSPFYLFFGGGVKEFESNSLLAGSNPATGELYFYFPMPFGETSKICFDNKGTYFTRNFEIEFYIDNTLTTAEFAKKGYLRTQYKSEKTQHHKDFEILSASGVGHMVGVILYTGITDGNIHLEGDERVYIDGSLTPQIYGTGTEDLFNGGWYFTKGGTFSRAYHGFTYGDPHIDSEFLCYRYFLIDHINFYSDIFFGLEHGPMNDVNTDYTSLALYYSRDATGRKLSDSLDVGNLSHQIVHNYNVGNNAEFFELTAFYDGDKDDIEWVDDGYQHVSTLSFVAQIDPINYGIKLRRRFDQSQLNQKARVYIDDRYVGVWYEAGQNTSKRWRDSDFEIHKSYTEGKSQITIRIEPITENSTWSDAYYWIFSYKIPEGYFPTVPVELSAFHGRRINKNKIKLEWHTLSETINMGFEIQRSIDNRKFNKVGWIDGAGTTNSRQMYSFIDSTASSEELYYRIKQIDTDGTFHLYDSIKIDRLKNDSMKFSCYPNPVFKSTTFSLDLQESGLVKIIIYDILGRHVKTVRDRVLSGGIHQIKWNATDHSGRRVSSGLYFYVIETHDSRIVDKLSVF